MPNTTKYEGDVKNLETHLQEKDNLLFQHVDSTRLFADKTVPKTNLSELGMSQQN